MTDKTSYHCLVCQKGFPIASIGGGHYPIRPVKTWKDALICNDCRRSNHDGVVPGMWPNLDAHLERHGIVPTENDSGWWPIPA